MLDTDSYQAHGRRGQGRQPGGQVTMDPSVALLPPEHVAGVLLTLAIDYRGTACLVHTGIHRALALHLQYSRITSLGEVLKAPCIDLQQGNIAQARGVDVKVTWP
jgi:hypothetical protein